jgi:hypothetical protein
MKQCPIVVLKTISYLFIILELFDYVSNAISNYLQNF